MIHRMMNKVFMQLVARFRKLGSTVVYASFHKLIISTSRPTMEAGIVYFKYILETIKARPLFAWIELKPAVGWETLIYLDAANYGGIIHAGDADEAQSSHMRRVTMHWNLAEYLPELPQNLFLVMITEFIMRPYQHEADRRRAEAGQPVLTTPQEMRAIFTEWLGKEVNTYYNRKMFKLVRDILNHYPDEKSATSAFPVLAGSHLPLVNPALEFIKAVSYVFSLDKCVEDEVTKLRTNLMQIVDVKSFSEKAQFVNPCMTYTLSDVIWYDTYS